ncbi:hypothetical protein ABZ860_37385 [Microbispora sp. NPDC046973]|uniref:hypothetical protein n=1 Tax=Microbispora sp. NPDC046973 TaxID=3155022 RepID=UPI0033F0C721
MTGYSRAPLPWKLGVKPGHRVSPVNAPQSLPFDDREKDDGRPGPHEVIAMFRPGEAALRAGSPRAPGRPAR